MECKDLMEFLQNNRDNFTPSQKVVADYVAIDPMNAAFCTVGELSEQLGVSTATIIRFANRLGYDGFADFQRSLKSYIQNRNNALNRFDANLQYHSPSEQSEQIAKICSLQLQSLNCVLNSTMDAKFSQAASLISNAARIFTIGVRGSFAIAYYLGHHLNRIFQNTDIISNISRIPDYLLRMKENDVLIIANMPRYSTSMVKLAKAAKARGVKLIVITDSILSPYCKYSDVLLQVGVDSIDYHNSLLPAMLVTEILVSMVCSTNADRVRQSLADMEPLFEELDTFTN